MEARTHATCGQYRTTQSGIEAGAVSSPKGSHAPFSFLTSVTLVRHSGWSTLSNAPPSNVMGNRDGRDRTCDILLPKQTRYRCATSRTGVAGIEPATKRLTVARSTAELHAKEFGFQGASGEASLNHSTNIARNPVRGKCGEPNLGLIPVVSQPLNNYSTFSQRVKGG